MYGWCLKKGGVLLHVGGFLAKVQHCGLVDSRRITCEAPRVSRRALASVQLDSAEWHPLRLQGDGEDKVAPNPIKQMSALLVPENQGLQLHELPL